MSRRAAVYLRVSTDGQTTENQHRDLVAIAERANWKIVKIYEDTGVSGAKGRDKRPAYDQLLQDANRREFDVVMAWSVDRLGRSLQDLVSFLAELHDRKIDLYLAQQGVDTTTASGKAMFQMLGVFAEFERAMIQQRVRAGLVRAKAAGKTLGRPRIDDDKRASVIALKNEGLPIRAIASETGVSVGTVHRILTTES